MTTRVIPNSFVILVVTAALFVASGCDASTSRGTEIPPSVSAKPQPAHGVDASKYIAQAQEHNNQLKLLPLDEGSQDLTFEKFRNDLLAAVQRRDVDFILAALHPVINNGYDIEPGVDEFRKRWSPQDSKSSVWDVLESILTGGGSFAKNNSEREFCGPYAVSEWAKVVRQLPKGSDSLDYVAITASDVAVRLEPKSTSPIVARLSYDVVRSVPNSQVLNRTSAAFSSWIKIITPSGQEGYVPDNYVQGPMDHGACFRKVHGKWLITKLATGE